MKVIVNGVGRELKEGATLKDAIRGEVYAKDSLISILTSTERTRIETDDYELMTSAGSMTLHLDDTDGARAWKDVMEQVKGSTTRWVNKGIVAFGSFRTEIGSDKEERRYHKYDCFFSLGGSDNHTTYMMIAKDDHKRSYGANIGNIGRITVGRHVLDTIKEGEALISIRPVVSEGNSENFKVTNDLGMKLEDGHIIDTNVLIELERDSPASSEHILAMGAKGYINISDSTGSFAGCSDDMDVIIPTESNSVRDRGGVFVRNAGVGVGHVLFYKERRMPGTSHNSAGMIKRGAGIISKAVTGDKVTVVTDPPRLLVVGMTQKEGGALLESKGIRQKRSGDTSDDAIIVDQGPEMTLAAMNSEEVETKGAPRDRVFRISLSEDHPKDVYYFRKVTGLSYKPVGSLKAQFSFPGMSMITFYGDPERSKVLYPQDPFKKCKKGDIGITNQSRPYHGLIGIRLADSKEYGPTGEEPYGTNMVGRMLDDLGALADVEEEETIYITEVEL